MKMLSCNGLSLKCMETDVHVHTLISRKPTNVNAAASGPTHCCLVGVCTFVADGRILVVVGCFGARMCCCLRFCLSLP